MTSVLSLLDEAGVAVATEGLLPLPLADDDVDGGLDGLPRPLAGAIGLLIDDLFYTNERDDFLKIVKFTFCNLYPTNLFTKF